MSNISSKRRSQSSPARRLLAKGRGARRQGTHPLRMMRQLADHSLRRCQQLVQAPPSRLLPRRHALALLGLGGLLLALLLMPERQAGENANISRPVSITPVRLMSARPRPAEKPVGTDEKSSPATSGQSIQQVAAAERDPGDHDDRSFVEVRSGDNLSLIFTRAGLTARDVYLVSQSDQHASLLTRLHPGYKLAFTLDGESGQLENLEVIISPLESYYYSRQPEGFTARHELRTPEVRQVFKEASIEDSLFMAAQRGGISAGLTMELADIFGGVIDFLLDTRNGDTFNILYEEKYLDGEFIGNGAILAAQFINQGQTHTAIRYTNQDGENNYYNPQGESMRKAFLRNPVDFVRISSNFNPNRRHPILNTIRAHKGTDYAAPTGTPVVAAGDGRVTWAARNGSFGNLVVIKHSDRFETKYAHLNAYAKGIRNGARVRQGQVIGYVGATGGATGPHLHYEFLMDGVHRNPRTIHNQLPKAESIAASELPSFRQQSQVILAQLNSYTSNPTLAQHTYQDES